MQTNTIKAAQKQTSQCHLFSKSPNRLLSNGHISKIVHMKLLEGFTGESVASIFIQSNIYTWHSICWHLGQYDVVFDVRSIIQFWETQ